MIVSPEGLLNRLVLLASCAGEQGCPVTRLLSSILLLLSITEGNSSEDEISRILEDPASTAHRSVAVVWKWIAAKHCVSIGENRRYNGLPLNEIVSMACKADTATAPAAQSPSRQKVPSEQPLTAYVSEATMWESLTGHGINKKRVPRSEWILLQGISSATSDGILQGDLGRLVGQDKRSVPKRTNCLVQKGYIIKRTTLVRGTKTSKLWLKSFAPSTAEDLRESNDPNAGITLSRHFLVDNLEPLPWRSRWIGDSMDYRALATTIMATCKAWNVIRVQDLKLKLGVLGMTWQMKVVSKICRFLNARGTIQYVAAKLDDRIFKDCIRFNRDMNERDWSIFLATGKRTVKTAKSSRQDNGEDDAKFSGATTDEAGTKLLYCPAWTTDISMVPLVALCILESGSGGITNPQLCAMTIGPNFTRFIAGLTALMSSEHIQPDNIAHLTIKSDRGRSGKPSSLYWYFMADARDGKKDATVGSGSKTVKRKAKSNTSIQTEMHGFSSVSSQDSSSRQRMRLSELCLVGLQQPKKRGRLKRMKVKDQDTDVNLPLEDRKSSSSQKRLAKAQTRKQVLTKGVSGDISKIRSDSNTPTDDLNDETTQTTADTLTPCTQSRASNQSYDMTQEKPTPPRRRSSVRHKFKCDKCCGTWKNDVGLKYHLEKSKTSCNPSFIPQFTTRRKTKSGSPVEKPSTRSVTRGEKKAYDSGVAVNMKRTNGKAQPILEIKSSKKSEKPIIAEMASMISCQAELLSTALTAPPRQVDPVARQSHRHTEYKTRTLLRNANTAKLPRNVPASLPEAPQDSQRPFTQGHARTNVTPRRSRYNSASDKQKVMETIMEILGAYNGLVPAGEALKSLVHGKFQLNGEIPPDEAKIKSATQQLIRDKKIVDQWHAFRAPDGQMGKCQIFTTRSATASAPEVRLLVEKIRQLYPRPISAEQLQKLSQTDKLEELFTKTESHDLERNHRLKDKADKRGRRSLATGIAVLDAPVYAAQISTKRAAETKDHVELSRKRRRGEDDAADVQSYPLYSLSCEEPFAAPSLPWYSIKSGGLSENLGVSLDVMFPDLRNQSGEVLNVYTGFWTPTAASNTSFNRFISSMEYKGWISGSNWLSWCSFRPERPEKEESTDRSRSDLDFLQAKLKACLTAELEDDKAIKPPTKKYSTFLNFMGGDAWNGFGISSVQWAKPGRWQRIIQNNVNHGDDDSESSFCPATIIEEVGAKTNAVSGVSTSDHQLPPTSKTQAVLVSRTLMNLPGTEIEDASFADSRSDVDNSELVAAFVVVRCLLGGVEKAIDWGLLVDIYPTLGLSYLRRFWVKIRKEKSSLMLKATANFQDALLTAVQNDEISLPNYDRPLDYDWRGLIMWSMSLQKQDNFRLPGSRTRLQHDFKLENRDVGAEDWREKFFHPQSSVFARFEASTSRPGTLTATEVKQIRDGPPAPDAVGVARSWIRSLCCTSETEYKPQDVKTRFQSLSQGSVRQSNAVLKTAVVELTRDKVICKNKRTAAGGRPYRFAEGYVSLLAKFAHRQKFVEAVAFKRELDSAFRHARSMKVPYAVSDGAMMALMNLMAAERLQVTNVAVPDIPFGFEPGNYESRKYPKSYYHLDLQVEPTPSYSFDDEIEMIRAVRQLGPPRERTGGEIPQWIDFFGRVDGQRWADILGGVCFLINTRGPMAVEGICEAMFPILEPFEAQLIVSWGLECGLLARQVDGWGITLGEWWWLVSQGPWS